VHRPENGTGTHCLRTPDYKGLGGGRKVIPWGNRDFWEGCGGRGVGPAIELLHEPPARSSRQMKI